MAYDWNNLLNPTRIEFILIFAFVAYMINLAYTSFVVPHLQGYFDPEQEKKIKQSKERQAQHHKELVELMSALAKSPEAEALKAKQGSEPDGYIKDKHHYSNEQATEEHTSEPEDEQKKKKKKKKAKVEEQTERNEGGKVKKD